MAVIVVAARIALAALFAIAGAAKLASLDEWRKTLHLVGLPTRRIGPIALLVALAELAVAAALTLNATARWGAVAALVMLVVFSGVISVAVHRHRTPDCNCFGSLSARPLGWGAVGRNILFAAVAGLIIWSPDVELSTTAIVASGAALAFALQAWFGFRLLQQNGRLLARVDALEADAPQTPGLAPGTQAPGFALGGLNGSAVLSMDLWPGDSPTLLAFVSPDCPACDDLIPDLARWQGEQLPLRVAVVTSGDPDGARLKLRGVDLGGVAVQQADEVANAYGVPGTPAAVLVDSGGRIASELALGVDSVRALAGGKPVAEAGPSPSPSQPIAGSVAVASAAGILLSGAATASARADDPGIVAIKAVLDGAQPTIATDVESLQKGIGKVFRSKKRLQTRAAKAALVKQREDSLALQANLSGLSVESAEAQATRDSGVISLGYQVQALDEFDHLLGLRSKKARKRSRKKAYELLQQARAAGYYLNVGLGCTGENC